MKKSLGWMAVLLIIPAALWAKGMALRFVDVVLENVAPGTSVNLREYKNLPLVVLNNDNEDLDVAIEIVIPEAKEMREGYEPIPDPTWIKILPDHFHLGPNASASSDVLITIPNDSKLLNHHYEAMIWAHSDNKHRLIPGGGVFLEVGLRTRVRMSIGTAGPASLQREKMLKKLATINTNFSVNPDNLYVSDVFVGKDVDLKADKHAAFKVINQADESISLKFKSVPQDPNIRPQAGYEYAPDPKWLELPASQISIPGNAIKEIKSRVRVPDDAKYRGKKYMFLVQTSLSDESLPLVYYNMLYVTVSQ